MKITTMAKNEYHQKFGALTARTSERALEAWTKLCKLPVVEYMVVEANEKGEKLESLRTSLHGSLKKIAEKTGASFKIRSALNRAEKLVVFWKEPK